MTSNGFDLSGKVAVVTGASGALCAAMCRGLAAAGAAVVALARGQEKLDALVQELQASGAVAVGISADVLDKASLEHARELATGLVRWVARFPFPDFEQDYEFVALRHPDEYPFNEGRLVSSRDINIDIAEYESEFEERHVPHSTALHSLLKRRGAYLVGPLARYALNFALLPATVQALGEEVGLPPVCRNPFKSIVVRALEILFACEEALRIIDAYEPPAQASVALVPRAATGFGCTEAPRGICWHRYDFAEDGTIERVRIVPPTSQNQPSIEADLAAVAASILDQPDDVIRDRCEQAIRNYDPCISCSAHFLKLKINPS